MSYTNSVEVKMKTTMSNWIANAVMVNSQNRFSFNGRMWMPALFDTKATRRVWKMSRQVGKSTGGAAEGTARSCMIDNFNILYVAPEQDQARKFSQDKLKPMIEQSPIIRSQLGRYNNVHEKEFRRGGKYYLKYAKHNPDSCRGITADMIHFDEVQDQNLEDTESVIEESLFTSKYKLRLYSGTPKSFANPIHKKWEDSDQREWLVKCVGCNKYNRLGIKNIGKRGPCCSGCGKDLDVDHGVWVRHNLSSSIAGFHVNQLHCKISHDTQESWDEILYKLENYDYGKFLNEVLGESADTAESPITEEMLMAISDKNLTNAVPPPPEYMNSPNFAGIDWGHMGASTVLVIGNMGPDGTFRNVFMKKYSDSQCDPDYCIPDMARIMKRLQVMRIHCDYGGGFGLNSRLAKYFDKGLVTSNVWSASAIAADQRWTTKNVEVPRLTLNRTRAISDYINQIRTGKISVPSWKKFHPEFSSDFLNIRAELRGDDSVHFVRVGSDDALHAAIYAYVICKIYFASSGAGYSLF